MSEPNLHSGHRDRLRNRYQSQGLDGFDDHNVLELLLCYAIPRKDVNELAHRLIRHFGSLSAVFDAELSELVAVEGIGERSATLIRLVIDLNRRYLIDKGRQQKQISLAETRAAGEFFLPYFYGLTEERVYVAFLDDKFRLLSCRSLFEGGLNYAPVSVRKLVECAITLRATNLIIAHNHPAGQALPSVEDRDTTFALAGALRAVELQLLDHIIVAGEEYISMEEYGYFKPQTIG